MNVLSLFDGISCGQQALKNIGAPIDNYFASEIDKHAINITQKNHPETIQIGDVRELFINGELDNLPEIDLLIGGSPCQNLSIAVVNQIQHNQGLAGEKSSLFYDYLGVLLRIKPKYFMLENVASMKDKDRDIISESLGVEPIMIDSALLVPQDRKRYYWTNIPNVEQPEEIQNILRDIMEFGVDEKYFYNLPYKFYGWDKKLIARVGVNGHDILKRVYNPNFKSPTLTTASGGNRQVKVFDHDRCRKLTPLEYERLQGLPDFYTFGIADTQRYNTLGNGWTVPVIEHIFKNI